jgi:hypothetical protein
MSLIRTTRVLVTLLLVAIATLGSSVPGHATFPGINGRIAYARDDGDAGWVYSSNPDGSGDVPLAIGQWPRWSPDGARIVYLCRDPFGTCIMNADGSGQIRFPTPQGSDIWAAWSPDGARLVFTHSGEDTAGDPEIFTANADGTDRRRLTSATGYDLHASWSPDGTKIAFVRDTSLWVMNSDGSEQTRLTFQAADFAPDWSPDGSKIAFQRGQGNAGEIYTIDVDGTSLRRLTADQFEDGQPAWSPDGTQIMFVSLRNSYLSNDNELFVMNVDGSAQTRVTFNDVGEFHPHWGVSTVAPSIPNTRITSGPSGWVRSTSATFSFESTVDGSTFTCSLDDGTFSSCTSPVTHSSLSDGFHRFRVRATAPNGVSDPTDASRLWRVDATPPTISFLSRTRPNEAGWNSGNVLVQWECSDGGSGVVSRTTSVMVTSEGADQSATGTCSDFVGNTSSDTQMGISIDRSPPALVLLSRTPANGAGWNNGPVTVEWSCSDSLSGSVAARVSATVSSEGANQSAKASCTDRAGNQASATLAGINIDRGAPSTTINAPALPIIIGPIATISGRATDNLSGVARTEVIFSSLLGGSITKVATCVSGCGTTSSGWTVSLQGVAPGLYTVSARSSDVADNVGASTLPRTLLII